MSLRWNGSGAGGHAWYALVAGAALLLACGARPGPEPLHEAGVFPDAGLPDAFVPSCELSFSACRVSAGPVKVGDKLDMPEGDWGAIEAVTEVDGDVVLLYGSWLPESDRNALWLVRLGQGAPSPAADLFRIDEAGNGADGTFL